MNLVGTIAIARNILEQLRARQIFGWPKATPVPEIGLEECARHFEMDAPKWSELCKRTSRFYSRQAFARYDPSERVDVEQRFSRAAAAIANSLPLDETTPRSLIPMLPILEGLRTNKTAKTSQLESLH
jgi:hypothetical protein